VGKKKYETHKPTIKGLNTARAFIDKGSRLKGREKRDQADNKIDFTPFGLKAQQSSG